MRTGPSVPISAEGAREGQRHRPHEPWRTGRGVVDVHKRRGGSAYVFGYNGTSWIHERKLVPADGSSYDYFGWPVAVAGDTIVVGAHGDDDQGSASGSAYVFRYDGRGWVQDLKLVPPDVSSYDYFGDFVAVAGDTIVVGAHGDDDQGSSSGSVYAFRYDQLYCHQGDYSVTLAVEDDAGNMASDSIDFTVDRVPPVITISDSLAQIVAPSERPFTDLFTCTDDDGASGDPVRERVFCDDCLIYDGLTYGDGDGLLSDEIMILDLPTLCEAMARCGLTGLHDPTVRVEGIDCGGNVGFEERTYPINVPLADCDL